MDKEKIKKLMGILTAITGSIFVTLSVIGKSKKNKSIYINEPEQQNPFIGKKVVFVCNDNEAKNADGIRGHLEAIGKATYKPHFYEKYIKRVFDVVMSFGGLVVLSPIYAGIALAIIVDDPGPVLFTQKRLGKNKEYFQLHKFRSMKMCTPHEVPTHMLDNPEQYITKVGKFLRAHSLDELPQIWDIFVGNMSVIGPRPGLWNQDVLTAERDKYGANDVKPGLTGWAQINGRDELEIPEKAKLDGEYVEKMGFLMDMKCFLGSVGVLHHDDSVVEGGTKEMKKMKAFENDTEFDKGLSMGIVTYNSSNEIDSLLDSIKNAEFFENVSVYVVDNSSKDDTVQIIKENYSWVHIYESSENLGFGKGHNLVINHVKSNYHIIVNPDIRIEKNTINECIEFLDKNPDIVAVTPMVLNIDGTQQFLPKRNPSLRYMIGGMFENYSKTCKKIRDEYTMKNDKSLEIVDIEFCSGCFMITRTSALQKVCGFDEKYFLHFEDADLSRELRRIGRVVYNPHIKVTHKWQRENKKINKSFFIALKSMMIYMKKWRKNA